MKYFLEYYQDETEYRPEKFFKCQVSEDYKYLNKGDCVHDGNLTFVVTDKWITSWKNEMTIYLDLHDNEKSDSTVVEKFDFNNIKEEYK